MSSEAEADDFSVEEVYSSQSYLGQLAGAPDPDTIVSRCVRRATQAITLKDLPVYVLKPEAREVQQGARTLLFVPPWVHAALIVGPEVPEEERTDGAHLLVVWFSKDMTLVIPEISLEVWREKAKNWRF